jgi:hypothetical protein
MDFGIILIKIYGQTLKKKKKNVMVASWFVQEIRKEMLDILI